MLRYQRQLANYFTVADAAIEQVRRDPEIAVALAEVGYDDNALQQGRVLLEKAEERYRERLDRKGGQSEVEHDLEFAIAQAERLFTRHWRLARVAFKKAPEIREALGLNVKLARTFTYWHQQAILFYTEALQDPEIVAALGRYGIDAQELEEGRNLVLQAIDKEKLWRFDECAEGDTDDACDAAIQAFDDWFDDFREVAKIALEDDAERLEDLHLDLAP
ncbi:MAG: hypothetical protein ACLFU8_10860 [Anaerolineales bacterium]